MCICCDMAWAVDCASAYGAQRFERDPVLKVGTSLTVPIAKNHCKTWYFYEFPRQHDSAGFTKHCPKLPRTAAPPHRRDIRSFENPN